MISFCQKKGKIVRNVSVKAESTLVSGKYKYEITNMNSCKSTIQMVFILDTVFNSVSEKTLNQYEAYTVYVGFNSLPVYAAFRNATPCPNGTTEWLTLDSGRLVDEIKGNVPFVKNPTQKIECEKTNIPTYHYVRDSTISTNVPQTGM